MVYLLIILFIGTATSKLANLSGFQFNLAANLPIVSTHRVLISWLVPLAELVVTGMLLSKKRETQGLLCATYLLSVFTLYIIYILAFAGTHKPCSCGGIISLLTWRQHLPVNVALIFGSLYASRIRVDAPVTHTLQKFMNKPIAQ